MIENTIIRKNREGHKAVALWLRFASAELVEMAAIAGFDAVHLDGEHGSFSREGVDAICRLANGYGLTVTARVPSNEPWVLNMYLDRGVLGIQGPHVETAAQARQLVDACYLPPRGSRSLGTGRGTAYNDGDDIAARWGSRRAFADWANANLLVWAQVESKLGVDNLDEILAVDGLTAIAGGIFDLAASLGHPGEDQHPDVRRVNDAFEARVRAVGKRMSRDLVTIVDLHDLVVGRGREIVRARANDPLGPA